MSTLLATRKTPGTAFLKGEYNLLSSTTAGNGSQGSPWTSGDGTAGLAALVAQIGGKGGLIRVAVDAFGITSPTRIMAPSIQLKGLVAGFPQAPNASVRAASGTRFFVVGTFLKWSIGGFADADRPGNLGMSDVGVDGAGRADAANIAHLLVGCLDQAKFERNVYSNLWAVYKIDDSLGGANLDTCYFTAENALYCKYGYYDEGYLLNPFVQWRGGCFSDLERGAFYIGKLNRLGQNVKGQARSFVIDGITLVRSAYLGGSAVYYAGNRLRLVNNTIEDTGFDLLNGRYNANCHGVVLNGNHNLVTANTITGHKLATGIIVSGYDNVLENNVFGGGAGDVDNGNTLITSGKSANQQDIWIKADAYDTTITQAGYFTFLDQGVRTVINGESTNAGDPDTAGDWNGRDKAEGLHIYDTLSGNLYEYNRNYAGGRRLVGNTTSQPVNQQPAGNFVAPRTATAIVGAISVEETDARIGLSTGWQAPAAGTTPTNFSASAGYFTTTAEATITVLARYDQGDYQVQFSIPRAPELGLAQVRIDGGAWTDVDQGGPQANSAAWYLTPVLGAGAHTVALRSKTGETRTVVFDKTTILPSGNVAPTGPQIVWFRNVQTTTTTDPNGVVSVSKTTGTNGDTTAGAVSNKSIGAVNTLGLTTPAFTLKVSNAGLADSYARFIGLTPFAAIGTNPSGERALEMPNRLYYDFEKYLQTLNGTDGPLRQSTGTISLVGYAENTADRLSRLELYLGASLVETHTNLSLALPLAIDCRLDYLNVSIVGATLTGQNLVDTPAQ